MATILIVEDVPSVMLSLRVVLEGQGHQVLGAGNGDAGLQQLQRGGIDLVITDIWMPGKHGSTVIAEGRQIAPDMRFLAITGGAPNGSVTRDQLTREGTDFGADRILFKPFKREELIAAVTELLPQAA
ncbi:response regulator [Paracraurococcus lichenis]|uniref:Response regulator n=1 Tax=Paracraurococcus lichenis TaxID=3064888 RepID=A0ABT9E9T7_9PROT|nr:response regulator [Paracraurococcus sp. LOR1-02]MDO9712960.1 response regulator [Paracraurococcus sp. LOR1-02]